MCFERSFLPLLLKLFSLGLSFWCPQAALLIRVPFDDVTLSRTRVLGKSCIVFLCCSQDLPTFIKYLLNVFHALSFQDCKNQNIQKTETLEQGVMVRGIPVHGRLEQEDCKFEASLKKSFYYFLEKILFYMLHGFLLHMCSCPREVRRRCGIPWSLNHRQCDPPDADAGNGTESMESSKHSNCWAVQTPVQRSYN